MHCPCSHLKEYLQCCGRFIEAHDNAATPEELMRSRYTAYSIANIDYIVKTMQGDALENFSADDALIWAKKVKWFGLKVLDVSSVVGGQGTVEFVAHYGLDHKLYTIHEISDFKQDNARWYYTGGKHIPVKPIKISPNDACPCGRGKKFKKCCS